MDISIIGLTLDSIGKVLLGVSVYLVHSKVIRERRIDKKVLGEMKRERNLVLIGIVLMIIGYLMQLPAKLPNSIV